VFSTCLVAAVFVHPHCGFSYSAGFYSEKFAFMYQPCLFLSDRCLCLSNATVTFNLPKGTLERNVSFVLKKLHRKPGLCIFPFIRWAAGPCAWREENSTVRWGYTQKGGEFLRCTNGMRPCLAPYYHFLGPGRQGRNELRGEAKMIISLKTPLFPAQANLLCCLIGLRLFLCHGSCLTAVVGSVFRKIPNKAYTDL